MTGTEGVRAMPGSQQRLRRSWHKKTVWGLWMLALAVVSAGFVFFLVGRVFVLGESAQAEIVDLKHGSKGSCAPVFSYSVDGRAFRVKSSVATSPCPWTKGERTTVYFHRDDPGSPRSAAFLEVGAPFIPSTLLLVLGLIMLVRKPRASEILETAPTIPAADVARVGRQIVRVRGRLEARGPLLTAPFTGRPCVAYWARASRKSLKGELTEVATASRCTALSVRDSSDAIHLDARTPLRLKVTADTTGDSTPPEHLAAIERFAGEHGASLRISNLGTDELVWYEAAFATGDVVELAGWAATNADGATLEPIEHGVVFSRPEPGAPQL